MSRRHRLLLPALLAAIAVPVAPAFAGEDDDEDQTNTPTAPEAPDVRGSAKLHSTQGCVSGATARAFVTGEPIESVAFLLDGKRVRTVEQADSSGRYAFKLRCARLDVGAHRGRAVVTFESGASPATKTLRFQVTRAAQASPRFTG